MCIAIYSPKGNKVPCEKYLKESFESNPDGAGFAFNLHKKVKIVKGMMTWASFWETFQRYDKQYNFKDRGVLIHFRIQTHGGVVPECTHPFPLVADEGQLHKLETTANYAVEHNGVISLTSSEAHKREKMSDTMVFIEKYLSRIATNEGWFNNPQNFELIYELAESKIAILDGKGNIHATYGFTKDEDGNYYSNSSYKEARVTKYSAQYWSDYYAKYYSDYNEDYDCWGNFGSGYKNYKQDDKKSEKKESSVREYYVPLMRLKSGEAILFEDGTVFEYDANDDMRYYITEDNEIFFGETSCFANGDERYIVDEVVYFGCGAGIVDLKNPEEFLEFRKDNIVSKEEYYDATYYGLCEEDY